MDFEIYSAKSVEDAITEACFKLGVTSDQLDYEVVDEGSSGGFLRKVKPASIKARKMSDKLAISNEAAHVAAVKKEEIEAPVAGNRADVSFELTAKGFLTQIFEAMKLDVEITTLYNTEENELNIILVGNKAGILIGKHGATLDSLQYILSLVINKGRKENESYIRVKLDSENYRERRIEALNNLAQSVAQKVRQTHRPSYLEPMNPYERRIIHTALQNNEYVTTSSQGSEPYRKVVVLPKRR